MRKLSGDDIQSLAPLELEDGSRFELKYRLNHFQYLKIRNDIQVYMQPDHYTRQTSDNRYLVRSLYFDTYEYRAYEQKMNGDSERVKFRVRTYQRAETGVDTVRVELKMRKGNLTNKKSVFVPFDEFQHFMKYRHWKETQDPITIEFERMVLQRNILPMVLVEYDREGYQTRLPGDLRITFDHHLRSAHAATLFPDPCFFQSHTASRVVMELKFNNEFPDWLNKLVRRHGLKVIANSKYTQAIQIARHDLYYPERVITVR